MEKLSDKELIVLYQKGNESALAHLIERYQQDLFTFIFYKIRDEDLANDFFQDTFIKIIITLKNGNYTETGKFYAWAKRIAHNLIIDYFRAQSKQIKVTETSYAEEDFCIFDLIGEPSANIEEELIQHQILEDLHKMLTFLPESQKEVIELRYFKGLSFKEIAEQTQSSINTTLGRARYALINLRKIMNDNKIKLTLE